MKIVTKKDIDNETRRNFPTVLRYLDDPHIIFNSYIQDFKPNVPEGEKQDLVQACLKVAQHRSKLKSTRLILRGKALATFVEPEKNISTRDEDNQDLMKSKAESFPLSEISHVPQVYEDSVQSFSQQPSYDYSKLPDHTVLDDVEDR